MNLDIKKLIELTTITKVKDNSSWEAIFGNQYISRFQREDMIGIEHNYNSHGLNLQIDPLIWSLASTNSFLEIYIHKSDNERAFEVYVDYYEDYYKLEKIIADIIKKF